MQSTIHRLSTIMMMALLLTWQVSVPASGAKSLSFHHTHTNKRISVTYFIAGNYDKKALADLNEFLADFRTGDAVDMDAALFDFLYDIQQELGSTGDYQVISAYRSPETNEMLRSQSNGVARKSQHLHGKAIDVRLTDVDTQSLRDTALRLQRGGVGYYQRLDFVHIDTGRVRRW